MKQFVKNYEVLEALPVKGFYPSGNSEAPKNLIFHILEDMSSDVEILDIGFGAGKLGQLIKANPATSHWSVDGVDGWEANCQNMHLFRRKVYRNVWHGFAQELSSDQLSRYKIICLLDVIEHLTADTARWLLRTLISSLGQDSYLFISTPLWFYPQDSEQVGDLEEHLIGVPASSMLALCPLMYAVNHPLVGGFVLDRRSLDFIEFFQPTSDKSFSYNKGVQVANFVGLQLEPGIVYKF